MTIKLPEVIERYIAASNEHNVASILACFSDEAVVRDEGETLQGKQAIEAWIAATIKKYKFHFRPLDLKNEGREAVVAVEVSGTFKGSPVNLDYHFILEDGKISSLAVE